MDYKTQIEDIIGAVGDDALISKSLTNAGSKIIEAAPIEKLIEASKSTDFTSSGYDISDKKVIEVSKSGYVARFVSAGSSARATDSGSIYLAATRDPVFYYKGEKVFISDHSGATSGTCIYVPKIPTYNGASAIDHSSTAVANFPLEGEPLMVLGASILCLQRLISDKLAQLKTYTHTDEDVELAQAEMLEVQGQQSLLVSLKTEYDQALQLYMGTTN